MVEYTIHADFDRDGKVSETPREAALSKDFPGAILIPNLDVDSRAFPAKAALRSVVPADFESPRKVKNENDFTKVVIEKNAGGGAVPHVLLLQVVGPKAGRLKVFTVSKNRRKAPLSRTASRLVEFELPAVQRKLTIFLEIDSFTGSLDIPAADARLADAQLELRLIRSEPGGRVADDHARFTISPLIFLDNGERAQRVYMCDMPSGGDTRGNEPSVRDFEEGMSRYNSSVPVILIPRDTNGGDAWIQDQYQIGYVHDGSRTTKRMVLHIPRLRANVVLLEDQPNLAAFVNSHFPSQNVGVCNDLWAQPAGKFTDPTSSSPRVLAFDDSFQTYLFYGNLFTAWRALIDFDFFVRPWDEGTATLAPVTVSGTDRRAQAEFLRQLPPSVVAQTIEQYTDNARAEARRLQSTLHDNEFRIRWGRLDAQMDIITAASGDLERVVFHLTAGDIEFTPGQLDSTFDTLEDIHASKNYGGNVEVIPPTSDAPLGKLLLGSTETLNRPLANFLEQQVVQPIVSIDTSWLGVGHVDEIVTFVRAPGEDRDTVCFYADTRTAYGILEVAFFRYLQGVRRVLAAPFENKVEDPPKVVDREEYNPLDRGHKSIWKIHGDHTVTRLFRGRRWLHSRPPGAVRALEPPRFYQELPQTDYRSVEGDDEHYDAAINLQVFLEAVASTNLAIQDEFIEPNLDVLQEAVPDATYIPIPALFDTVRRDAASNERQGYDWDSSTGAIIPGSVNMQIVGKTLFIPRQYTARMRADDVIWVLKRLMPARYHARLNKRIFKQYGLDDFPVWLYGPFDTVVENDILTIAVEFQDGFWEYGDDDFNTLNDHLIDKAGKVKDAIYKRNKKVFLDSGRTLKDGWQKLYIPENTVDLFEAYIQTVANHHGFNVHWVDTWYYHLRAGQIHCGTNVVRKPNPKRKTPWWTLRPEG